LSGALKARDVDSDPDAADLAYEPEVDRIEIRPSTVD
jgi:hypothetical protein